MKSPSFLRTICLALLASVSIGISAPPPKSAGSDSIPLDPENGIASGATRMGGQFRFGGLEHVGLFIGNPNNLHRADRVVMTFDLTSYLRKADKVKSAQLVFFEDYFFGPEDKRVIELVVFNGPLTELTEEALASPDTTTVKNVEVSATEQNKGGLGTGKPYEIDITAQILDAIKAGQTSISFRMQDVKVEENGNPGMIPEGITLDKRPAFLPVIEIELKR